MDLASRRGGVTRDVLYDESTDAMGRHALEGRLLIEARVARHVRRHVVTRAARLSVLTLPNRPSVKPCLPTSCEAKPLGYVSMRSKRVNTGAHTSAAAVKGRCQGANELLAAPRSYT